MILSPFFYVIKYSVLDEPTAEAVCIVANTDKWTVDLVSSDRSHGNVEKYLGQEVATSHMVQTLLESVQSLAQETGRTLESDFVSWDVSTSHHVIAERIRFCFCLFFLPFWFFVLQCCANLVEAFAWKLFCCALKEVHSFQFKSCLSYLVEKFLIILHRLSGKGFTPHVKWVRHHIWGEGVHPRSGHFLTWRC